jgi:predicted S18 family serine protease
MMSVFQHAVSSTEERNVTYVILAVVVVVLLGALMAMRRSRA